MTIFYLKLHNFLTLPSEYSVWADTSRASRLSVPRLKTPTRSSACSDWSSSWVRTRHTTGRILSNFDLGMLIFSGLTFVVEKDANPDEFISLPAALYWAIITMTSVSFLPNHTCNDFLGPISGPYIQYICTMETR